MSSSREQSPDWLRSYEAPNKSLTTFSLSSSSSAGDSPGTRGGDNDYVDDDDHEVISTVLTRPTSKMNHNQGVVFIESDEDAGVAKGKKSMTAGKIKKEESDNNLLRGVDSDEKSPVAKTTKSKATRKIKKKESNEILLQDVDNDEETCVTKTTKSKDTRKVKIDEEDGVLLQGDITAREVAQEEFLEKTVERPVSSTLPLVFPDKVQRSKALVECEGDSLDMSGDVGAVGRVVVSNTTTGGSEVLLDLKGTVFKTTIIPSRTFFVVSFGPSEAKIEAMMNDFIQLKPFSNVFECETMVEGTLEGFSYESEEEADKIPKTSVDQGDKSKKGEDPSDLKSKKRKDNTLVAPRKRAKLAGKAKSSKKPQGQKKSKKSKK